MKLTQIRDLMAVAERGSLRAAARHLGVAQPAMTRSIRDLEHELGAALLTRTPTGVRLTEIGRVFLKRASIVQHELDRACAEVRQLTGLTDFRVTVGLATAPHIALLPKVLPAFYRQFPSARLDVVEGLFPEMEARLRESEIDFYVGPTAEGRLQSDFTIERLHNNIRMVFGRPGHPLSGAKSLADLVDAKWVSTLVTIDNHAELGPVFERLGLPAPQIAASAHSAISTIMIAASTDLLALMPQQWILLSNSTGLLCPIEIKERIPAADICIIKRSQLPLTRPAEHLADLFRRASLNQADYAARDVRLPLP